MKTAYLTVIRMREGGDREVLLHMGVMDWIGWTFEHFV